MTGLTNNQIVEYVYRNYKINHLIRHMIDYSVKDKSCDDLEQYIYEQLLKFDNVNLNNMFNNNKLRNFISQIVLRQRNGGVNGINTEYQNILRIRETNEIIDIPEPEPDHDFKMDVILNYIDDQSEMYDDIIYTESGLKTILSFSVFKKYFLSSLTQEELAKHLGLSRSTITSLIKSAKFDILNYWDKTGQFIEFKII